MQKLFLLFFYSSCMYENRTASYIEKLDYLQTFSPQASQLTICTD
uniref:Uncharacterized protein n=1 Tax=Arundo donax TaxID=35708 RepID=A0A0A9HBQ9_ARUDO